MRRVLYATIDDSSMRSAALSGFYVRRSLAPYFDLSAIGPLGYRLDHKLVFGGRKLIGRALSKHEYPLRVEPSIHNDWGRRISAAADQSKVDLVITNNSLSVPQLCSWPPYVVVSDAPVCGLIELGTYFDGWARSSVLRYVEKDRSALLGAALVVFTSEWAATSAIKHYGVKEVDVLVVPPGPNLDNDLKHATTNLDEPCLSGESRLLFYGRDWERKGGPVVLAAVEYLNEMGISTKLVVCGPTECPHEVRSSKFVEIVPPIDKDIAASVAQFKAMCSSISLMILPTKSDCTPIAIAEVAMFGVPTLAADVGGMSTMIEHGVSGVLMRPGASSVAYAEEIAGILADSARLRSLRQGARSRSETVLNWEVAARSIVQGLERHGLTSSRVDPERTELHA